ncbi:hypothetical protein GG344DRAFT_79102 [Lentinula edodes]|nr:hypothetical protein GG344DRAFT_79102 [Lentinula edodes]
MPNPQLPNDIETSRSKYKNLTARFLKWLSCRAEDMKITSLDELEDESTSGSVLQSKTKINPSRRTNAHGKKKKTTAESPVTPKTTLPTVFTVGLLVRLAEKITQVTNLKVPDAVFTVLDDIIELRSEVASFYHRQGSHPRLIESNHRHRHFIECLRKIRRYLELCPTSRPDNALVKLGEFMSLLGIDDNSAPVSSVQPPLDEDWLPDNLRRKASTKKENPTTPMHDRPLSEFSIIADGDNGKDESEVLAWMFFHDLARLREHVRGIWGQYCQKEITLVTASFLTTQSIEIVKEMEEDFFSSHSQLFSGYLDLVKVMFRMHPKLDIRSVVQELIMMDSSTVDFTMSRIFHSLWQFGMTLIAGNVPCPKPGFFPTFHPEDDRSSMDDEQLAAEDLAILMPHLSEVAMQCKLSSTEVGKRAKKSDRTTVDEQALVRDMRAFIIDSSRPKPFHLIFQWAVYKDTVLVTRKQLKRPLEELLQFSRHIMSSFNFWEQDYDFRFYSDNDVDSLRPAIHEFIQLVQSHVLTDRLGSWKDQNHIANLTPYQLWHYNPWACGAALYSLLLQIHHTMVQVSNGTGYLGSVAHLYHALRVHGQVEREWPHMDKILEIVKECAFNDHFPEKGKCLMSFSGFLGSDPALSQGHITPGYKSNGYGTGVLPKDFGGSLPGRLSELYHYRLTDNLVAELFPRQGELTVARRSRIGIPPQPPLRFGGKRCDAFSLLDVLKQRIESDLINTALGLDLFAVQRMSISILRRWSNRTKEEFIGCFGPGYMERPTQIVFLPGYMLKGIEYFGKYRDSNRGMSRELVDRIVKEAVRSLEEGREDLEKSLDGGAKMFFLSK